MGLGFLVTEMSQEFVLSAYVRIWVLGSAPLNQLCSVCLGTFETLASSTRLIFLWAIKAFKFVARFIFIILKQNGLKREANPSSGTSIPIERQLHSDRFGMRTREMSEHVANCIP